jgi:hypothetical protein
MGIHILVGMLAPDVLILVKQLPEYDSRKRNRVSVSCCVAAE